MNGDHPYPLHFIEKILFSGEAAALGHEQGQEATIRDLVEDGGISARQSTGLLYYLQNDPVPSISAPHSFALDLAKPFDHTIVVTGQMDQMSMSGNLPPGINFDSYSSRLSGVPVQLGSYAITITIFHWIHIR